MMNYLAFDIGGTYTKFAVINHNYQIIEQGEYPTLAMLGKKQILKTSINKIKELKDSHQIQGVAISSPGIIDYQNGIVSYANQLMPNYAGTNFAVEITQATDLRTTVENDVNCFALSETLNGNDNFIMITIGTGIGGAIVFNNRIFHGINNSAGEFGQMVIDNQKWEDLASVKSLLEKARLFSLQVKNGEELFNLYDLKNIVAMNLIAEFYNNLAKGICNLAYLFNPSKIILGGGITKRKEAFLNELNVAVNRIVDPNYWGSTVLSIGRFMNDGGLIGALVHHLNQRETVQN
ncbi:MAG TPA: ROK family protein [Bacilli bacterium]|nr:ROK family protein [Bacilli bacterium]HPX83702.1 ROK family protein [Bacilli bacterium]